MESTFGWTQISRSDVAKATELLKDGEKGVRDEIGFLSLHQGFADRFFPGTSVLQTRLRYALFVPWQMQDLIDAGSSAVPAEIRLKRSERQLVLRLRNAGHGVIGLRSERHEPAQPPSFIYWSALKAWGILNPAAPGHWPSRAELLGQIEKTADWKSEHSGDEKVIPESRFFALPQRPDEWIKGESLTFQIDNGERQYLLKRLTAVKKGGSTNQEESLLARLAKVNKAPKSWVQAGYESTFVRNCADPHDKEALQSAASASALAHIGRAVYSALIEGLANRDTQRNSSFYRDALAQIASQKRSAALRCRLDEVEGQIGKLEERFHDALEATLKWLRQGGDGLESLWETYAESERWRKREKRARLLRTPHARALRATWMASKVPRAEPLNYRWHRVGQLLDDLHGNA